MIKLKNVKKSYFDKKKKLEILDVKKLQIKKGERVALVGPSGSGKTTLLKIISAMTSVEKGLIEVMGKEINKLAAKEKDKFRAKNIGYIYQELNLLDSLTSKENLLLATYFAKGETSKKDHIKAEKLLKELGLGQRINHIPEKLSQGEKQRVAIARALMNDVKIILADEPTGNVDYKTAKKIIELLEKTCNERDLTLIMVTHDREFSNQFERKIEMKSINQTINQEDVFKNEYI